MQPVFIVKLAALDGCVLIGRFIFKDAVYERCVQQDRLAEFVRHNENMRTQYGHISYQKDTHPYTMFYFLPKRYVHQQSFNKLIAKDRPASCTTGLNNS